MDNRNFNGENTENSGFAQRRLPAILALITAALAVILSPLLLSRGSVGAFLVLIAMGVGSLSFAFISLKQRLIGLIPAISAAVVAILTVDVVHFGVSVGVIIMLSALFAIIIHKGVESFSFFIVNVIGYGLFYGIFFVVFISATAGSLSEGLVMVGEYAERVLFTVLERPEVTSQLDEAGVTQLRSVLKMLAEMVVPLIPSAIFALGCVSAWITSGTMRLFAGRGQRRVRLFKRETTAPVGLAILYIVATLITMFTSMREGASSYAIMNMQIVLAVVFTGVGVKEFFAELTNKSVPQRRRIMLGVTTAVILCFMYYFILVLASVYGATRIISRKISEKLNKTAH